MIHAAETETAIYQQENVAIKTTLFSNGVEVTPAQLPALDLPPLTSGFAGEQASAQGSPQWDTHPTASASINISVAYDERINDKRLRVSPIGDFGSEDLYDALPLPSTGNADTGLQLLDPATLFSGPPPHFAYLGAGALDTMPRQLDTSVVGINFILA